MKRLEIPPLTSLRFFAAGAIVVHHLPALGIPHSGLPLAHAVPFFFALSGFILTYNYEGLPRYSPGRFMLGRIARLWPVHLACLAIGFLFLPSFRSSLFQSDGIMTLLANVVLVHDWIPSYRYAFSYNSVSWSISAEVFFYLSFTLLIASPSRMAMGLILAVLINLCFFYATWDFTVDRTTPLFETSAVSVLAHLHPLATLPAFILGMLSAALFRRLHWVQVSFPVATLAEGAAIALVVWWIFGGAAMMRPKGLSDIGNVYYSHNSPVLLAPAIIFIFAWNAGLFSRFLSLPLLVHLGEISFSTYMLHQLIMRFAAENMWSAAVGLHMTLLFVIILIYGGSHILWRFVERPARHMMIEAVTRVSRRGSEVKPSH